MALATHLTLKIYHHKIGSKGKKKKNAIFKVWERITGKINLKGRVYFLSSLFRNFQPRLILVFA